MRTRSQMFSEIHISNQLQGDKDELKICSDCFSISQVKWVVLEGSTATEEAAQKKMALDRRWKNVMHLSGCVCSGLMSSRAGSIPEGGTIPEASTTEEEGQTSTVK